MKKISFIGIGLMGLPMAKKLLEAGYPLKAYNRTQAKSEKLKKYNAEIVKTIKEAVSGSDVIITMLTDDLAVDLVMKSSEFLDNLKSGSTVIDMSSVKPETAKFHGTNLKSKNINYLDAPVWWRTKYI
jgi:2-hydroxy-3-oxopropionate reductase